jgi:hypothetical protein
MRKLAVRLWSFMCFLLRWVKCKELSRAACASRQTVVLGMMFGVLVLCYGLGPGC